MTGLFAPPEDPKRIELFRPSWRPDPKPIPEVPDGAVWGRITCIPADEMPIKWDNAKRMPYGFWTPLVEELELRLDCTPQREALRIPFATRELARRAYNAIRFWFKDNRGDGAVELRRDGKVIFIRRSTTWRGQKE